MNGLVVLCVLLSLCSAASAASPPPDPATLPPLRCPFSFGCDQSGRPIYGKGANPGLLRGWRLTPIPIPLRGIPGRGDYKPGGNAT